MKSTPLSFIDVERLITYLHNVKNASGMSAFHHDTACKSQ